MVIKKLFSEATPVVIAGAEKKDCFHHQRPSGMGAVRITVQDSGPGLNPESFDRLFDPFYTTKADGMGMGLSICRSIVEAHEGRMSASRAAGPGSTFEFVLPGAVDKGAALIGAAAAETLWPSPVRRVPNASV
jgi:signal transduction histidine kinase